jgi:hypothetical protein
VRRSAGSSKFALSGYRCTIFRYTSSSSDGAIATCFGIGREKIYTQAGGKSKSEARRKGEVVAHILYEYITQGVWSHVLFPPLP